MSARFTPKAVINESGAWKSALKLAAEIAARTKQAMGTALEGQAKMAAKLGKPAAPMLIDIKV